MNAILNPAPETAIETAALSAICPAYVLPAALRPHKQAGARVQVTARRIKGGKWEGIFRDVDGQGVESAGHATETDAVKAVAFYTKPITASDERAA